MTELEQIRGIYENYQETLKQVIRDAKPFAGFMGIGSGPKDDPCHRKFLQDLEAAIRAFLSEGIGEEAAAACAGYILGAQASVGEDSMCYWTMLAAHGQAEPLLPLLSKESAARLALQYDRDMPRRARMPMQEKMLKTLREMGGEAALPRRKRFLFF